jgi:TNF receptor-associated factor 4
VYANGYNEGRATHLSVYAFLLKGKYDSELTWPFVGEVTVTLLNQLENRNHFVKTIVVGTERNVQAHDNWGYPKFISNSKLGRDPVENTQYLKDDALYFRVSVNVSNQKSWLECTVR